MTIRCHPTCYHVWPTGLHATPNFRIAVYPSTVFPSGYGTCPFRCDHASHVSQKVDLKVPMKFPHRFSCFLPYRTVHSVIVTRYGNIYAVYTPLSRLLCLFNCPISVQFIVEQMKNELRSLLYDKPTSVVLEKYLKEQRAKPTIQSPNPEVSSHKTVVWVLSDEIFVLFADLFSSDRYSLVWKEQCIFRSAF